MDSDLNVIVWLLLIAGLIISTIFTSIAIYDYTVRAEHNETVRNNNIIQNCIPNENYKNHAIEIITNKTHSFQPQTCKWLLIQDSIKGVDVESWTESLKNSWIKD